MDCLLQLGVEEDLWRIQVPGTPPVVSSLVVVLSPSGLVVSSGLELVW